MTAHVVLRTPAGPVRFRVNKEALDDEPVLVREEAMKPCDVTRCRAPTDNRQVRDCGCAVSVCMVHYPAPGPCHKHAAEAAWAVWAEHLASEAFAPPDEAG